jgi:competence protein ComFB
MTLNEDELQIRNYMEDCILDLMEPVLDSLGACKCDNCIHDIYALALNNLPPKYVVSKKGQVYTRLSALINQFEVDIISAITNGSVIVSKSPRHDD